MPATQIVPIVSTYKGIAEAKATLDVVNGMALPANDGKYIFRMADTDAAQDATITLIAQAKYGGLTLTNPTITVTHSATAAMYAGPFDPAIFNDGGSNVQITGVYTGTANLLTICAIHLG